MSNINDSISTSATTIPGLPAPAPAKAFDQTYTLWYMERPPHLTSKNFEHTGSFQEAIELAKVYCQTMRYRFVIVRPFISDLIKEMRIHTQD